MPIAAVEPIIRAEYPTWPELVAQTREATLADLRAKVEALPIYSTRMEREWVDGVGWMSTDKVIDTILRSDVLALFPKEEDSNE